MRNLAARLAALEKKREPVDRLPFEVRPIEESERLLARVVRSAEEKARREATLTTAERLALRRKKLEELDAKPVFTDPRFRVICEFTHTAHRRDLLRGISHLEQQLLHEQEKGVGAGSHNA